MFLYRHIQNAISFGNLKNYTAQVEIPSEIHCFDKIFYIYTVAKPCKQVFEVLATIVIFAIFTGKREMFFLL